MVLILVSIDKGGPYLYIGIKYIGRVTKNISGGRWLILHAILYIASHASL